MAWAWPSRGSPRIAAVSNAVQRRVLMASSLPWGARAKGIEPIRFRPTIHRGTPASLSSAKNPDKNVSTTIGFEREHHLHRAYGLSAQSVQFTGPAQLTRFVPSAVAD